MSRSRVPLKSEKGQRIRRTQGQVVRNYGKAGRHADKKHAHNKTACRESISIDVISELSDDYPSEWDELDPRPMPRPYYED